MKVSLIFAVFLISQATCGKLQTVEQATHVSSGKEVNQFKGNRNRWKRETSPEICNEAKDVSVQSVFVADHITQFFIENFNGSMGWTSSSRDAPMHKDTYPQYMSRSSGFRQLGNFRKVNEIRDSKELQNDGKSKRVSASFWHFSDSPKEKAYLVLGLNAYEFKMRLILYYPTGNVTPITDFFKDGEKLLMPEDKLKEVVSVSLIKWIEKDKLKDHAIYKIILKTATKKLIKAYFKLNSKGEVINMNSEPFVPSAVLMEDADELNLLEESALYYVGEKRKLSMGYQFIKRLAFPIYYDYNPEKNTYIEYPMRTKNGFNSELEKLADKIPYWNRYIVPAETFLGCPDQTFCLGSSFDAVFFAGNQYYAIFDKMVYTLESINSSPGTGVLLESLFILDDLIRINAAFSFGAMIFFMQDGWSHVMPNISVKNGEMFANTEIFPQIDVFCQLSAVITLDKRKEASENSDNIPSPSKLKTERLEKNQERHERAAETTKEDISKMVYVYCSTKDRGNVYQYEMETKEPPQFKLIAKRTYNEVNAALPKSVSLVFTAEDKVITMVHHFVIEQSSETFFTQTDNQAKFTLLDKYFGCKREMVENELTKEFVQNYVEFAGLKPGVDVFTYAADTQDSETVSSTSQSGSKDSGSSAFNATPSFIITVIILFGQSLL